MYDTAIIGGSFAGLTAALQLGRAGRSTLVIDAGQPRNHASIAAHGVPGWDGAAPAAILERFQTDLSAYPTVRLQRGKVASADSMPDGFMLDIEGTELVPARRIILALGVTDILPDIPGIADAWGKTVLHCPYCHGHEVRGQRLAVLAVHPMSEHQAKVLRVDWSDDVTFIANGSETFDTVALTDRGIAINPRRLATVEDAATGLRLTFSDGTFDEVAALFLGPRITLDDSPAAQLGCALGEKPIGPFVRVGPMAQTTVAGVFAAGDLARPSHSVTLALGDVALAGVGCHQSLLYPEFVPPLQIEAQT